MVKRGKGGQDLVSSWGQEMVKPLCDLVGSRALVMVGLGRNRTQERSHLYAVVKILGIQTDKS